MKTYRNPLVLVVLALVVICVVLVKLKGGGETSGKEIPKTTGANRPIDRPTPDSKANGRKKSERKPQHDFIQKWSNGETFTAEELLRQASAVTLDTLPEFLAVAMAADIPGPQRSMLTSIAVAAVTRKEPIADVMGVVMETLPPGKIRNRSSLAAFELSGDSVGTLARQMKELDDTSDRECALEGLCLKMRQAKTLGELGLNADLLQGEEGARLMTTLGMRITQENPDKRQAAYEESYQLVSNAADGRGDRANVIAAFVANSSMSVPELAWETWQSIDPGQRGDQAELAETQILKNLAMKRPEAAADQILSGPNPADTPRQLTKVLETWMGADNNAAELWGSRMTSQMDPATLNATAAFFARFHLKKGANENAGHWIERITNPDLKKQLSSQLK